MNIERTLELARHAEKCGADAISAVPPFYFEYDEDDIYNYYARIAGSVNIPLMIYYTPSAAVTVSMDLFRRLLDIENITAVKWTYSDYDPFIRLKASRDDISVMNGPDETLLCGLAAGADGGIGSTYNFMLPKMKAVYNAFASGDIVISPLFVKGINRTPSFRELKRFLNIRDLMWEMRHHRKSVFPKMKRKVISS